MSRSREKKVAIFAVWLHWHESKHRQVEESPSISFGGWTVWGMAKGVRGTAPEALTLFVGERVAWGDAVVLVLGGVRMMR